MSDIVLSPNMSLPVPIVSQDLGPDWANNVNSCLSIVDQHTHTSGSGVPITSDAISISSDLPFGGYNATLLRSVRFSPNGSPLSSASDIGCIYESGIDLWYNDGSGNQVQITANGSVNATSSGIASGTASAAFSLGVLVVNAASLTPANIQCASILLGDNVANSKYVTLSPPNSLGANYNLVLPSVPGSLSLMTLDSSGNMGTATSSFSPSFNNISVAGNIHFGSEAFLTNIANTMVGVADPSQTYNLPIVVSAEPATNGLQIVRGVVGSNGAVVRGEGFSSSLGGSDIYTITFNNAFYEAPVVIANSISPIVIAGILGATTTTFSIQMYNVQTSTAPQSEFYFIAIGQRLS